MRRRVIEVVRRVGALGPERLGLAAVVVAFLAASTSFALQMPPFFGADEHAHLGYAHEIAAGRLPEITDTASPPADAVEWRERLWEATDQEHRTIWVANHPPLFYVLTAPLVWLSDALGRGDGGLLFLRLVNLAFAAVGIVFTYLLAKAATGGARRVALAAAALVAFLPLGHGLFAHGMTDGLGFAAATAVTWAGLRAITHGFRRSDLVLLGATAAVAAGARAATMLVAVAVVALVSLVAVRRTSGGAAKARVGGLVSLVGLAPAALLFGWFYARNVALYGDFTGSDYLFDYFRRAARGTTLEMFTNGPVWSNVFRRFMASPVPIAVPGSVASTVAAVGATIALAGLALGFVSHRKRHRALDRDRDGAAWLASPSATVISLTVLALVVLMLAKHAAGGGSSFARYLFPALGVIGTLAALGLHRLRPHLLPALASLTFCLWAAHFLPSRVATVIDDVDEPTTPAQLGAAAELALLVVGTASSFLAMALLLGWRWTPPPARSPTRAHRPRSDAVPPQRRPVASASLAPVRSERQVGVDVDAAPVGSADSIAGN